MFNTARILGRELGLSEKTTVLFEELGKLINYNSYGNTFSDLHYHPIEISKSCLPFANPREFIKKTTILEVLRNEYNKDLQKALNSEQL